MKKITRNHMKKTSLIALSATTLLAFSACNQTPTSVPNQSNQPQTGKVTTIMNMDSSGMSKNNDSHQTMTVKSDLDFILNMIPHHQEAVDSSEILLSKTTNTELKTFLQNVITQQSAEIKQMRTWSQDWFKDQKVGMGIYTNMMPSLNNLAVADAEQAYLEGMIAHHQGAISMAEQILNITTRPELKQVANDIITNQTKEIEQLKVWLKQ